MRSVFIFGLIVAACDSGGSKKQEPPPPQPKPGAIRVAFGDCAQGDTKFVSGPRPVGPEDRLGAPPKQEKPATTELDSATINRVVRQHMRPLKQCYARELAASPKLEGKVKVSFTIGASGAVTQASATGMGTVGTCIEKVIKTFQFPATGSESRVTYPFIFRTEDGTLPPETGELRAFHADPTGARPLGELAPAQGSGSAAHGQMPVQSVAWESGGTSPLRAQRAGIEACVRQAGQDSGVFVVGLDFDQPEAKLAIEGAPAPLATCLEKLEIQKPPGAPTKERCGVAFGQLTAPSNVPAIMITATEIQFDGKPIRRNDEVMAGPSGEPVAALRDALAAWTARASGPIAIRGVGMIEPVPTTPMKLIYLALRSTYAAEVELVLARMEGSAWVPLRELAVPVEPIAAGTGGSWNDARHGTLAGDIADLRPRLSLYVQGERIWIGLSGVMQFQEVPARDWKNLERILREQKAKPDFAARADYELAADDAVTFADVVEVIRVARGVGFSDWRLVAPGELTAAPTL